MSSSRAYPQVHVVHAATNTPSRAPDHAQLLASNPQHQEAIGGELQPAPRKKRGPKVGRKAAMAAAAASGAPTWLPSAEVASDPYAFHCEPNPHQREMATQRNKQVSLEQVFFCPCIRRAFDSANYYANFGVQNSSDLF